MINGLQLTKKTSDILPRKTYFFIPFALL